MTLKHAFLLYRYAVGEVMLDDLPYSLVACHLHVQNTNEKKNENRNRYAGCVGSLGIPCARINVLCILYTNGDCTMDGNDSCLLCYRIIIAMFFCASFQLLIHFPVDIRAFMLFYKLISLLFLHQREYIQISLIAGTSGSGNGGGSHSMEKIPG